MIKLIRTLSVIGIFISGPVSAQWDTDTLTFEDNDTLNRFSIDTVTGCWQRGIPSKTFFNSAWAGTKAMVTDTLNFYPSGANDYFEITFHSDVFPANRLMFNYKIDCDSLTDGGWIEIYNYSNSQWENIFNGYSVTNTSYPFWITPYLQDVETLNNGQMGYTGYSQGWRTVGFDICPMVIFQDEQNRGGNFGNFKFRFNFISDGINNNREGWMIDDIQWDYSANMCPSGVTENMKDKLVNVFPNPAQNQITFESSGNEKMNEISIIDLSGRKILTQSLAEKNKLTIDISAFSNGMYFYFIKTKENQNFTGKFIRE